MVDVGDLAPDFALKDQDRNLVSLAEFKGNKSVVLVFYPKSFTGVCQGELCAIRDDISDFSNDAVQTLAVSVDTDAVHKKWANEQGYTFPMLADFWPHGAVAQQYGVFDEASGLALRGTFIIDKQGIVVYKVVNPIPDAREHDDYLKVLATLA